MAAVAGMAAGAADFCGEWSGKLSVGVASLKVVLHVEKQGEGYACTFDSPMQGAYGIPCAATVQGDSLTVDIAPVDADYKGVISADDVAIEGDFSQMGQSLPLTFHRVVKEAEAPKPYKETEVMVDAGGGVQLAGTFSLPQGDGPFPAVVALPCCAATTVAWVVQASRRATKPLPTSPLMPLACSVRSKLTLGWTLPVWATSGTVRAA